jgi:pectin methylesterase-like acyl-CoA thioesterase
LALALCLAAALGAQTTWIVDASNGPGTHFTTIQAAVNASSPGDKIFVKIGLYVENVVIDKGITMVGWNATTYPMTVPGNPYAAAIQGTLGIVAVDNFQTCVISGFSVVPNGPPESPSSARGCRRPTST